jgi:hypothetical protein
MYLYHAHAVALGGAVERPSPQTIGALASCVLPIAGGTSSASEGKFDNGLIAFDSAQSALTGSEESRSDATVYVSGVSVIIRGLNIRNMFTADEVVLRIASEHAGPPHPKRGKITADWGEAKIITTGSHFDNLKIAGYKVTVEADHKFFSDCPTYHDFQIAWQGAGRSKVKKSLMGSTLKRPPGRDDPEHLREIYRGFDEQRKSAKLKHSVLFSFVKEVKGIGGAEIDNWGPIIRIPQFGTIYLGEVIVSPGHRRVNMFRLQLGSPDGAGTVGGSGGSNGTGFP